MDDAAAGAFFWNNMPHITPDAFSSHNAIGNMW